MSDYESVEVKHSEKINARSINTGKSILHARDIANTAMLDNHTHTMRDITDTIADEIDNVRHREALVWTGSIWTPTDVNIPNDYREHVDQKVGVNHIHINGQTTTSNGYIDDETTVSGINKDLKLW